MQVEYLCDCPEYVGTVAGWIYSEFVVKAKGSASLAKVTDYFSGTGRDSFPITLIAIENGECLGTVSLFENDLKNQQELKPWLASLFVREESRGQGVAQVLIERLLQIVKLLGYDMVYLRTEHTMEYYRARGWQFVRKAFDERGVETHVFRREV